MRASVLAGALLLPALLSGCVQCVGFNGSCEVYEGVWLRQQVAGDWDRGRLEDAFATYGNATVIDDGTLVVYEEEFSFRMWAGEWTDGNESTWEGVLGMGLSSPRGQRSLPEGDVHHQAQEEWPGLRHHYDRVMADLATAGIIAAEGTPIVQCLCAET